jgi:hypothetical protein
LSLALICVTDRIFVDNDKEKEKEEENKKDSNTLYPKIVFTENIYEEMCKISNHTKNEKYTTRQMIRKVSTWFS